MKVRRTTLFTQTYQTSLKYASNRFIIQFTTSICSQGPDDYCEYGWAETGEQAASWVWMVDLCVFLTSMTPLEKIRKSYETIGDPEIFSK